ncbi:MULTISPECIES: NAD(P)H-dependent oxidoreductase [unclassified Streptomyces]|uniref:NAD(P)H-dependent oxidoreductase n=1 Tax=unclassified Streptomyces TaxID=2593676 RepID=UPI00404211C2
MNLTIITGGLREPSSTRLLADRLDAAVTRHLGQEGVPVESAFVELRPLAHPIRDAMLTGIIGDALQSAFQQVAQADGVIAVTPAFNASFSGLFKSFFDVMPEQTLSEMPVLMGATGGTERHSLVLEHPCGPRSRTCTRSSRPGASMPPPATSAPRRERPPVRASPPRPPTSAACCAPAERANVATSSTRTSPPCNSC